MLDGDMDVGDEWWMRRDVSAWSGASLSPAAGGGYQRQARGTLGVGRRSRTGLERVIGVAAHAYDGIGSLGCGHAGTLVGTHASADSSPPASRPAARRTIRGCLHHLHA